MDALYNFDQDFVDILGHGRRKDLSLYRNIVIEEQRFRYTRAGNSKKSDDRKKQYAKCKKGNIILTFIQGGVMVMNIGCAIYCFVKGGEKYNLLGWADIGWAFIMLTLMVGTILSIYLLHNETERLDTEENAARLENKLNFFKKCDEQDFTIAKESYEIVSSDPDEMLHAKKDILDEKLGL